MHNFSDKIGVIQGRLLPKFLGRYQAHPVGYWADEFPIAASLGLSCIEFIFDYNDYEINPLFYAKGINDIKKSIDQTGVQVRSICADYFMEAPIHSLNNVVVKQSVEIMIQLFTNAKKLGVTDIVLPCVDQSSFKDDWSISQFEKNIQPILEIAEKFSINLSLETDLDPKTFAQLLSVLPSSRVKVNYDTGNSASLGFDPIEEFNYYGDRISDIHIKDRKFNGGSVELGTGNVDFERFFVALKTINYAAPFIMQVYRDDEGVSVFKKQLAIFKQLIEDNK
jgi:L-ribulose-5-phosphate 3-epimerase